MPVAEVRHDPALLARLEKLTLGQDESEMLAVLMYDRATTVFVASRESEAVLGWAYLAPRANRVDVGIFVDPLLRRAGIGTTLIRALLAFAQSNGIDPKTLRTYAATDAAHAFYASFGIRALLSPPEPE